MENGYTFDEVKRERTTTLIGSLILELAWQDKITGHKDVSMTERLNHYEVADIFVNRLSELEDDDYKEFIDKLTDMIVDI